MSATHGEGEASTVTTMVERAGLGSYTLPERIDAGRVDLAEEFLARPLGRHSEPLQLLLGRMRSDLSSPRLVVQRRADGEFLLLRAPGERGAPPEPLVVVATREDAERYAFRLRWEHATGTPAPGTAPATKPPSASDPGFDRILGYTSTRSASPGEEITLHVSAPGAVEVHLVRLRSRRRDDAVAVDGVDQVTCAAAPQGIVPGSHGRVPLTGVPLPEEATLQLTFCSVGSRTRRQVLASWGDPWSGDGLAIHLEPGGRLAATAGGGDMTATVELPELVVEPWAWHTVAVSVDERRLELWVVADGRRSEAGARELPQRWRAPSADLVIGAVGGQYGRDHFNGRVEQVALAAGRPSAAQIGQLATPGDHLLDADLTRRLIGWWDFSVDMGGWTISDRGPDRRNGTWHNLPRRGVCGSRWDGVTDDWREAPEQYAAVHLLADAVEDPGWPITRSLTIPEVPSGFYAFRVQHGADQVDIPFTILPAAGEPVPILLLVPTATYTAYANSRFWWEDPIQEAVSDRLVEIGAGDRTLMARNELGLSHYDQHADGTDVTHVSDRRPNMYLRADNVHDENFPSDLDLVEWLDARNYTWAAVTDRDLDSDPSVLDRCQVLLSGTHPEYVSGREFDELEAWVGRGGRMLYLGGNGFQTRVHFDRERPWVTENRRIEHWGGHWPSMRAERRLAADGELAGYVTQTGRSMIGLLGVESVTMGFDESRPFRRLPDRDPRTAFVFAGVDREVIGDHGRLGGAVVGQEWDNAQGAEPVPDDHHVLARSEDHSIVPALFGAARAPYHCDMTIRFDRSGGAVFSVGTMAWCAALNDEDDDVSRITGNVINRFLNSQGWAGPGRGA